MPRKLFIIFLLGATLGAAAQKLEPIAYGDFENWITRNIKESRIIGGKLHTCYAIGPEKTIEGSIPLTSTGDSPWATSNVMAKVVGITKVSNAIFPDKRGSGRCAKLTTRIEECKALGMINIDVLVAGTMFLGKMLEPITSTSDPYTKMEMGIPFSSRPEALVFDYKLEIPANAQRIYSSGFGKKKERPGNDRAEVFVLLQKRWEDSNGNLYAKRVGTARELFGNNTATWVNKHSIKLKYGEEGKNSMNLIPEAKSYYARNSKGKLVPVKEVGWEDAQATPTHMVLMFSSGSGEPYTGTPGLTFWVDNVAMAY